MGCSRMCWQQHQEVRLGDALQGIDPEFLTSVLGSLPGVETSDPAVQEAVSALSERREDSKKEEDKSNGKKS